LFQNVQIFLVWLVVVAVVVEAEVEEDSVVEVSRLVEEDIEVATEVVDGDLRHTRSRTW
jgi:hypothetical protein